MGKAQTIGVTRMWEMLEAEERPLRLDDGCWRRLRQRSPQVAEQLAFERRRLGRLGRHEREAGDVIIAGLDEVGRGPMAGPLVAAAVVFRKHPWILGLNDSKQLLPEERTRLRDQILEAADDWAIGEVSVQEMQQGLNMHEVNLRALERARGGLRCTPDLLLIDGRFGVRTGERQKTLIKGDCLSYSIAAASIVAKVYRDALMDQLHHQYPQYGFNSHKGYATPDHVRALEAHGPCAIHRPQFRRVRELLEV